MPHAELDADVGRVRLRTTWNQKQLVQQVPGARWDAVGKHWTVPLSWASLAALRGTFGDELTVDQPLSDWTWIEYRERVQPALELRDALTLIDDGSPEVEVIKSWRTR